MRIEIGQIFFPFNWADLIFFGLIIIYYYCFGLIIFLLLYMGHFSIFLFFLDCFLYLGCLLFSLFRTLFLLGFFSNIFFQDGSGPIWAIFFNWLVPFYFWAFLSGIGPFLLGLIFQVLFIWAFLF